VIILVCLYREKEEIIPVYLSVERGERREGRRKRGEERVFVSECVCFFKASPLHYAAMGDHTGISL